MIDLYRNKIENCSLHILIVSGLYGILRHDDYINDYNLKIDQGKSIWGDEINNAICDYMKANNIPEESVYYSLSKVYKLKLNLKQEQEKKWKNVWIFGGEGSNSSNLIQSARCVSEFLNKL